MIDKAPELFRNQDLYVIAKYLNKRGSIFRGDVVAQKIVKKCLICHDGNRIFMERKSRLDWEETVTEMRRLAKNKLKKKWFGRQESEMIVDLLFKIQSL
ncbi:hypothetical protein SCALIN_C34_0100 [Candidatus Scalindua japonica]|uniref:Uncharacterized protein n=1 Tax=Candidatus Scalindua japonica TaxID=1284222 RepID=A0A286U338_9BACT|nr:hypothetical protein [Candidatus Scalindua japonica]GAX62549.1 hypothetical protein SCALIN_C34_0100 [Candidatus Scalindua japonica]